MKITTLIIFTLSICFLQNTFAQKNISDVQTKSSWLIVFDAGGQEISRMSKGKYQVAGISSSFFVVTNSDWIITFNDKCKEIARMALGKKQIKVAAGETFTVLNNGWTVTYYKNCKEKNRRPTK